MWYRSKKKERKKENNLSNHGKKSFGSLKNETVLLADMIFEIFSWRITHWQDINRKSRA